MIRFFQQRWFLILLAVTLMAAVHGALSIWRRAFMEDRNIHSERFFRIMNEAPTVLLFIIVIMVIVKPF